MTSMTTMLALLALVFFGGEVIRSFSLGDDLRRGRSAPIRRSSSLADPDLSRLQAGGAERRRARRRADAQAVASLTARRWPEASSAARRIFPGRAPIEAYGHGGFRFADMSHRGSILACRRAFMAWRAGRPATLDCGDFAPVLAEAGGIEFLLLGTGGDLTPLPPTLRAGAARRRHRRRSDGDRGRRAHLQHPARRKTARSPRR